MESHIGNIMTLSNSIIGVSILAMPFCFKQCGVLLAFLILIMSSIITRLTCHFLLKSAIMSRRRTFELLAFHAFGTAGKFMIELGIIGFLMGTCIAFFVIIGDLGPAIVAKILDTKPTDTLRTSILVGVALFCILPLGLLKNVDSLHSVSIATIGFYFCLVLKTISESAAHFMSGDWLSKVEMWKPAGVLQCIPIFAMALSCQTQLFEIYGTVVNPTLDKMNYIVKVAINICVGVYVCVGFFGYSAFANKPFTGNILMSFSQSPVTDVMKIGFVLSVAFSFPLVIFPCRASLYSLLFKKGYTPYEGANNYIPESKFKFLTVLIIAGSLTIGILIPNIEVVLGLLGSTIGTMICLIFPVTCFICISTKNTNERLLAQILLFVGVIVMVMGTYANLYAMEQINEPIRIEKTHAEEIHDIIEQMDSEKIFQSKPEMKKIEPVPVIDETPVRAKEKFEEIRLEPPQPVEPQDDVKKKSNIVIPQNTALEIEEKINKPDLIQSENKNIDTVKIDLKNVQKVEKSVTESVIDIKESKSQVENEIRKAEEVDKEAIKKEETELQEEEKNKLKEDKENEKQKADLLKTLEEHKKEQEDLIKEQKELIQELKKEKQELKEKQKNENKVEKEVRRQAASQILEIAKKAIEQLAPDSIGPESINKNIVQNNAKTNFHPEISNNDKKTEIKSVIMDPIARKIIDFANNNNSTKVQNQNNKNEIPIIPLPIALNKNATAQKLEPENDKETKNNENLVLQNNKTLILPVPEIQVNNKNEVNSVMPETNLQQEVHKEIENQNIPEKSNRNSEKQLNEINEKNKNQETNNQENEKIVEQNDNKENILPIRRDILANEENTDNGMRVKRDADNLENSQNDEKCQLTDKNKNLQKTESPLIIKLITEISRPDILKIESNNLIQSMKSQLVAEALHMKRK